MKSFFFTALFFAVLFLSYDLFLAPPGSKLIFRFQDADQRPVSPPPPTVAATRPSTPSTPQTNGIAKASAKITLAQSMASQPPASTSEALGAPPPEQPPTASKISPDSVEAYTKNWTEIPPRVFPREVHLVQETVFNLPVGNVTLPPGRSVIAVSFREGMLALTPASGSPLQAIVPVDQTDLKDSMRHQYNAWRAAQQSSANRSLTEESPPR